MITDYEPMGPQQTEAARHAYEKDIKRQPNYHDGTPRKKWHQLDRIAQLSWRPRFLKDRSKNHPVNPVNPV